MFYADKFILRKPPTGGKATKWLSYEDSLQLVMVLPSKLAMQMREKFCRILVRYFASDKTIAVDLNANATSDEPMCKLAREHVAHEETLINSTHLEAEMVGVKRLREEYVEFRKEATVILESVPKLQQMVSLFDHLRKSASETNAIVLDTAKIRAEDSAQLYLDTKKQHDLLVENEATLGKVKVDTAVLVATEVKRMADEQTRFVDQEERSLNILKERNAQSQLVPEPLSQQVQVSQIAQSQTQNVKSILQLAIGMPEWVEIHVNTKGIILAKAGNAVLRASIPPCPNKVSETAPSGRLYDVYVYESIYFGQIVQIIRAAFAATQRGRNNGHILPGQANISAFFNGC